MLESTTVLGWPMRGRLLQLVRGARAVGAITVPWLRAAPADDVLRRQQRCLASPLCVNKRVLFVCDATSPTDASAGAAT